MQPHTDEPLQNSSLLDGFACNSAKIRTEVSIDDGRMDILIECAGWGIIAIENKIWAIEQRHQISRYAKHLVQSQKRGEKFLLLYLTLDGKQSREAGEFTGKYYRISYHDHIQTWLDECLRATYQYININQALQQYRSVVSQLIGSSYENVYMEKVVELLRNHPEIIKNWREINSGIERMKLSYWKDFVEELRKQLSPNVELGPPQPLKNRIDVWFSDGKHSIRITDEISLGFLIQWSGNFLRVGAVFCGGDKHRNDVWSNEQAQFALVRERLKELRQDFSLCMEGSDWWPLGAVALLREFISNEFLVQNACNDSPSLQKQVKPIAGLIVDYLNAAKTFILEAKLGRGTG